MTPAALMAKVAAGALDGLSLPAAEREPLHVYMMRAYSLTMIRTTLEDMMQTVQMLAAAGCDDAARALAIIALDACKASRLIPDPGAAS